MSGTTDILHQVQTAGIVLAAGLSRRMGKVDKLLIEIGGASLMRRVAETALEAGLEPVVVVIGPEAAARRRTLEGLPVSVVENPHPEGGLSSSLARAIDALDDDVDAAVVLLGDMPWVETADIVALITAFDPEAGREICVPVHEGRRGNPVLWASRFFEEIRGLRGDVGARPLLQRHAAAVHEVQAGPGVLRDVDTPAALSSS